MTVIHTTLLVEDEEDLRELMRDVLESSGYVVVAARDGQEALESLEGATRVLKKPIDFDLSLAVVQEHCAR